MTKVRDILGPDRDSEFLQSFVRVGLKADEDGDTPYKSIYTQQKPDLTKQVSEGKSEGSEKIQKRNKNVEWFQGTSLGFDIKPRRKKKDFLDEIYTDKDRAAAVSLGSYDIKQSLITKRRQDRSEALQIPDEAEPGALFELGLKEYKNGNTEIAIVFISKALELNPADQNALVARSKCYLLLGDPAKGLEDAETALAADKTNIRAIYQKAESLYFLGQFEHSLMFFHRGLKLRPELNSFRLGVQKSQEAIEKTIGGFPKKSSKPMSAKPDSCSKPESDSKPESGSKLDSGSKLESGSKHESGSKTETNSKFDNSSKPESGKSDKQSTARSLQSKARPRTAKVSAEKREARKLLGELCIDKEYLENLLKHPDLKRADNGSENISTLARDAVQFLNNRQEFWRQQRPCTAAPQKTKVIETPLPKWYN